MFHRQIGRVEQFPGPMFRPLDRKWNIWNRIEQLSKKLLSDKRLTAPPNLN